MELDLTALRRICNASVKDFIRQGELVNPWPEPLIFIDNGADILAVAHLDTVLKDRHFVRLRGGDVVISARLDDRLGVYIITELLPKILGDKAYDILLTTGEERGRSTALHFKPPRDYKWVFEFDRRGRGECALYQYDSPDTKLLLRGYGWKPVLGTYTDVVDLEHLGVVCFNFSAGYQNAHQVVCYAEQDDIWYNVKRFVEFYQDVKDTYMPWHPRGYARWTTVYDDFYNDFDDDLAPMSVRDLDAICPLCNKPLSRCGGPDYCALCDGDVCENTAALIDFDGTLLCEACVKYLEDDSPPKPKGGVR